MSQPNSLYQPPSCPECGDALVHVLENTYDDYRFNAETGQYQEVLGSAEVCCPHCDGALGDIFEDGACNYQAKERV